MFYENVLETIGKTPLIKLSNIADELPATVFGKVEAYNPGQSAKDRTALYMVQQAENRGDLKPGSTIIEATSGNTGYSLAMVCAIKGYHCVLTVSSKASKEKLALLRSLGAEVVICPANVEPEDPRSYYSRAEQLSKEIPGAYYLAQNFNLDNQSAHYATTGPEIWEQTGGKITHYVCCAGTGGTLSGTAQFLKEKNPNIRIIAVDAYGSALKKFWETGIFDHNEIFPYKVEGLGKTIIPDNVDFTVIDDFIKVTDKDSAIQTRSLARREGLLVGYSAGSAMQAVFQLRDRLTADDVVVVLFPDHGTRYLGKVYSDEWMREQGFLQTDLDIPVCIGERQTDDTDPYSIYRYEAVKKKYKTYYRTYRMKYKRYIRQTRESLGL